MLLVAFKLNFSFSFSLPSDASEAVLVKMFALIDVILDTVANGLVAEEALGRVVGVTTFALKRSVRLGEKALTG